MRDSKLLPAERREVLAERIREHAVAWAIAAVDAARIDQINIYQASRLAMREAVFGLDPCADHLLVDALRLDCELPQQPIIHGDALSASIAAASILAKVERDRMIVEWDPVFPVYGLASNKGYSTPRHLAALREHGPSPLHRQSFRAGMECAGSAGCAGLHAGRRRGSHRRLASLMQFLAAPDSRGRGRDARQLQLKPTRRYVTIPACGA